MGPTGVVVAVVDREIAVLPPQRAYTGSGGRTEDTRNPGLLGPPDAQKVSKDISKDLNNKHIPFHAHERAVQRADTRFGVVMVDVEDESEAVAIKGPMFVIVEF